MGDDRIYLLGLNDLFERLKSLMVVYRGIHPENDNLDALVLTIKKKAAIIAASNDIGNIHRCFAVLVDMANFLGDTATNARDENYSAIIESRSAQLYEWAGFLQTILGLRREPYYAEQLQRKLF